jgi:protein disulfide-isomerase
MPILFLVKGETSSPLAQKQEADLLKMQPFVKFVNTNFVFYRINVPAETDKKPESVALRKFMTDYKIPPLKSGIRMIVFDWYKQGAEVRDNQTVRGFQQLDDMIEALDKDVPNPDYNGRWLEDYKDAKFISNRLRRPLFICFTQMDGSEYCQKFFDEVFNTPQFKEYVKKNIVLMRVDFPKDPAKQKEQSDELKEQNRQMADTFAIRGYPTVVILNFMGQRIGDSKYIKGGPENFIKQLDGVVRADKFSRP